MYNYSMAPTDKRSAFITGGGGGIGLAIAWELGMAGYRLMINGRHDGALKQACSALADDGIESMCARGDVTDPQDVESIAAFAEEQFGGIDVLVNNVGVFLFKDAFDYSWEEWIEVLHSNVSAAFLCSRGFLPLLERSAHPRIVNIGVSYAGVAAGHSKFGPYGAAKAALLSLTRTLAVELAPVGVTVNAVSPGMIDTGVYAEEVMQRYEEVIPAGRFGTPEEVARVVRFLAEPESDYITGADVPVAGGWFGEIPG